MNGCAVSRPLNLAPRGEPGGDHGGRGWPSAPRRDGLERDRDSWFGVELRHLAALVAIDQQRSFRGAADQLGYVQSAVSRQIAVLERLVGARLVERTRGHSHVDLTAEGTSLVEHARAILGELNTARADLHGVGTEHAPAISIGASPDLAAAILGGTWTEIARRRTPLALRVAALEGDELSSQVERGAIDIGCAELPLPEDRFATRILITDPMAAVVSADHPLARAESSPSLAEISQLEFATNVSWRMRQLIEAHVSGAGEVIRLVHRDAPALVIQETVAAGVTCAVLPLLAVNTHDPRIRAIDLSGLLPSRPVAAFWRPDRHPGSTLAPVLEAMERACATDRRRSLPR